MGAGTLTGRCLCGGVNYEVSGDILYACHCHCESCRRGAGAPFVTWATFDRERFVLRAGTVTEHESSPGVRRGHCANCGTSLTYESARRRGEIDISVASLDEPDAVKPLSHIWVEDKLPWIRLNDGLRQHQQTVGN